MGDENVGLAGALYAKAAGVTNHADNEICEFEGAWTTELITTTVPWYGQSRTKKSEKVVRTDLSLKIAEAAFKPSNLEALHGFTLNAADTIKSVAAPAASSWTLDADTEPTELEWLLQCMIDGKIFQAFAEHGIIEGAPTVFSNMAVIKTDVSVLLYAPTGTLMKYLLED